MDTHTREPTRTLWTAARSAGTLAWVLLLILVLPGMAPHTAAQDGETGPMRIVPEHPTANETIYNATPLYIIRIETDGATFDTGSVAFAVDGEDVTDTGEAFTVNATHVTYTTPAFFKLQPGRHNLSVQASTTDGDVAVLDWSFTYDPTPPVIEDPPLTLREIVLIGASILLLFSLVVGGVLVYLTQIKGWSFRKIFVRFPVKKEVFTIWIPAVAAIACVLGTWFLVSAGILPDVRYMTEYIAVIGLMVGVLPFAIDVQRARAKIRLYEKEYAQFLFEFADALRGGIDPIKGLTELAKTETGVLGPHLRAAAEQIRLGRPFEEVLVTLATPMESGLIMRYSRMIGEAAKVGGDVSIVIFRAAKDMDDFVKIELERVRKMKTPMMTVYIAFGVLLMMTNTLVDFAPELAQIDLDAIAGGQIAPAEELAAGSVKEGGTTKAMEGLTAAAVAKVERVQTRFFHLLLIGATGTGLLVGAFSDGKLRYGLVHMLIMLGIATVSLPTWILP